MTFNLLYSILYGAVLVFILPFEYLKRPAELRKRWLREKFGILNNGQAAGLSGEEIVWIHAVSVGEVIASVSLIKKIRQRHPSAGIVISTVTDTGQNIAAERTGGMSRIVYVPLDMPFAINNAVKNIRPSVFIIMETELWPNIIRILNQLKVPVLIMNGRISEKSFNGYKKIKFFIQGVLKNISFFCMQNELYADRIQCLGADPEKVRITGSFKFDTKPFSPVPEWTAVLKGRVIIAGSTHRTEEALLLDTYIKLRADFHDLNLIIAPRHPERFREVEELVKKKGLEYIKISDLSPAAYSKNSAFGKEPSAASRQLSGLVVLLDIMGELSSVYGASDIAVMGGSFIEHGGQNPLEPAYWGKTIVCGPHMENFPFIDDFYKYGGAVRVDAETIYESLKELLLSPGKILSMGNTAKELYERNTGSTEKAMEILETVMGHRP